MRTAGKLLALLLGAVLLSCSGQEDTTLPAKIGKSHPYLFANEKQIDRIVSSQEPVLVTLREALLSRAEAELAERVEIAHKEPEGLRSMRMVEQRLLDFSFAWKATGDRKWVDAVRAQFKQLNEESVWGPHHFLNIGECSMGVALAYDWLYDEIPAEERAAIEASIVSKAFDPSRDVPADENNTWMIGDFNWNQICHGGMVAAALAMYDAFPEEARFIIERAVECVPYATRTYGPDGVYNEGASYWEYGTSYQVLMMDAMNHSLGHCFALDKIEGFMQSIDFKMQLQTTTLGEYSYSDYEYLLCNEPAIMWFARELGRADLRDFEAQKAISTLEGERNLSRLTLFDLLWWPDLKDGAPVKEEPAFGTWMGRGKTPVAVMRTDVAHGKAYLAFKGGTSFGSHGHQDAGSFIYEREGVRWAVDIGRENYARMSAAGIDNWNYSQNSSRWSVFRPGPDSHNIVRIDGERLISLGVASDMELVDGTATLDIAPLYDSLKVSAASRALTLGKDGNLSIEDRLTVLADAQYTAQWLTYADVALEDGRIVLSQDGKSITLTSDCDAVEVDDVSEVPGAFNSPNPGLKRLRFVKQLHPDATQSVTIKIAE